MPTLERRLGRTLPPSYRGFLAVSNGWRRTTPFIEQVYSAGEVDYFRVRNQEWIDSYVEAYQHNDPEVTEAEHRTYGEGQNVGAFRVAYLRDCVQISEVGDAAVYLLNPGVVTPEGEWEAWFLSSWGGGVDRYRSFWEHDAGRA